QWPKIAGRRAGASTPLAAVRYAQRERRRRLSIAHRDHHETCVAAWQLRLEFLVHAFLQHGPRQRRVHTDPAFLRVGFVGANDAIGMRFTAFDVFDIEARAEEHRFAIGWYAFGDFE